MNDAKVAETTITIARDFSKYPAGRFRTDGKTSGEAFRDDLLVPALRGGSRVVVVFDGVAGFGSSFLEEAFGGLVRDRQMREAFLDEHLCLQADDPDLADFVELARRYIKEADRVVVK